MQSLAKERFQFADIVALDRYPINRLHTESGEKLIKQCQQQVSRQGVFTLPGFLTPQGLKDCQSLAQKLAPMAFHSRDRHNPIFSKEAYLDLPENHPWRQSQSKQLRYVANDDIPSDSSLQKLFDWPVIRDFVAVTLGYEKLYQLNDPVGALSINIMGEGDHLGWHFDTNDFIVAIPLQTASEGGVYEYCPYIWDRQSPNWQVVTDAIQGDRQFVKRLPYTPGSLVVFCGRYSLHRVTNVIGAKHRMVALLAYHHNPEQTLPLSVRMHIYGKTSGTHQLS